MRFTLLVLCISSIVYGQDLSRSGNNITEFIDWQKPIIETRFSETKTLLYFTDAQNEYADSFLPRYFKRIDVLSPFVEASLANQVFQPLSDEEIALIPKNKIEEGVKIKTEIVTIKKMQSALISFIPIRKNGLSGKYEKLVSFELLISPSNTIKNFTNRAPSYASNSVLQNGDWYKISTSVDGIYKITYSYLQSIGISPNSIDPRNIRIYGNGGKMLPEHNAVNRQDDLLENAIYVEGEADGVFDPGDYILFYGQGPHGWKYDPSACTKFTHSVNLYNDSSYYFITADLGPGKRIQNQGNSSSVPTDIVTSFDDRAFYEKESTNLMYTGKLWFSDYMTEQTSLSIPFSFSEIVPGSQGSVKVNIASRYEDYTSSFGNSTYLLSCQGTIATLSIPEINGGAYDDYANLGNKCFNFTSAGSPVLNITQQTAGDNAWLDYIDINVRRKLIMSSDQLLFRDVLSSGSGKISQFRLTSDLPVQIWEISDPSNVFNQTITNNGSNYEFTLNTDSLRGFAAFNGSSFLTPGISGRVMNQNLHALSDKDFIIISAPAFYNEALRLASHHETKDNLSTVVVTTQQIYNEFSSGSQDVSAIRDFVKMFYDKATSASEMPQYLLLFGDASYDYKNRIASNTNLVPTYESASSMIPTDSYCTDDFYGALDNNEGLMSFGDFTDIGIGRIPAKTPQEAAIAVNKILLYTKTGVITSQEDPGSCTVSPVDNPFGDWRNTVCIMADDEDNNLHVVQANTHAEMIDSVYRNITLDKIYFDAYEQESTSMGNRFPGASEAIEDRVKKGALIINYTGHGAEIGLAHERVLTLQQIEQWKNKDKMFLLYTAACEFSKYDNPELNSGGEISLLNPDGGAIALLSANRLVFSSPMFTINRSFFQTVFEPLNGRMPRLGDISLYMKNNTSGNSRDGRCHSLLGDPALTLAYPKWKVVTDSVNGIFSSVTDTLKALDPVTISGHVTDNNGTVLNDYNGILYPTVFDKKTSTTTLSNDGAQSPPYTFKQQKNILFKGKVSVVNGSFKYSFVVPKDINYTVGIGRISYYADNGIEDASGSFENVVVGGMNSNPQIDNSGPQISLYMNDTKFVQGGITNEDPDLLAILKDENGINTLGNGIGHDLKAVLDGDPSTTVTLNDYYHSDMNTYKSGSVRYPFDEIPEGKHTLEFTSSDVYNNTSKSYLEFVVAKSAELALSHVLNYPNPFTTRTSFFFEQNQCCQYIQVELQIFSVSGKMVKSFNETIYADGYRSQPVVWDGRDDFGDKIGKGVYVYRLKVKTESGQTAEKYEKLVILN